MANKLLIKRGNGAPNNASIDNYELVYNYTDNELWTKHNGSVVKVASGNVGTVTNVVAGNGLTGGGTSTATLDLDFSELTDMTGNISGTTEFILQNGTVESRKAASEIKLSAFNDDISTTFTTNGMLSGRGTTAIDTTGDSAGLTINYLSSTASGKPTGSDHSLLTMSYSSLWQNQIAQDWRNDGRMFIRGQNNGTWSSWHQVYSDDDTIPIANGGTGATSAAAARVNLQLGDLAILDNISADKITSGTIADARIALSSITQHTDPKYLRSDATSGTITSQDWNTYINGTEAHFHSVTNHSGSNRPSGAYGYGVALSYSAASQGKFQLYAPEKATAGSSTNEGLWYRSGWNTTYRQWAQIWDSTNDGSGSGLDADLLDGNHGSHYLNAGNLTGTLDDDRIPNLAASKITSGTFADARIPSLAASKITSGTFNIARIPTTAIRSNYRLSTDASNDANSASTSGVYRIDSGYSNLPSMNYGTLVTFNNMADTGFQIAADYHAGGGSLQWRAGNSSTFGGSGSNTSWFKIWNEDNDGANSGLDADLLDGNHASAFATLSGTQTFSRK